MSHIWLDNKVKTAKFKSTFSIKNALTLKDSPILTKTEKLLKKACMHSKTDIFFGEKALILMRPKYPLLLWTI